MPGQQRKKKPPDRLLAEIRRHIADAQAAVGIAVVGVRLNEFLERFGVLLVPAAMFLIDHPGVVAGMEMEGVDQIAVRFGVIGLEPNGLPIGSDRLVKLPLVFQGVAEIAVRFGVIRLEPNGLPIGGDRLVKLPLVRQGVAEIAVRFGVIGLEPNGLPTGSDGLVKLPLVR